MPKFYSYLLIALCLCACRKSIRTASVIDPAIAGSYIVTTYCYTGPPPNYQPVVTTTGLSWSVSLIGDSSIRIDRDTARLSAVSGGAYSFTGLQAISRTGFVAVFDSAFHTMRAIYDGPCDSCGGCQAVGVR